MPLARRLAALAVAVAGALPGSAGAAPPPPVVYTDYSFSDGVQFSGVADGGRVRVSGAAVHVDVTRRWVDSSGTHTYTLRGVGYCLAHSSSAGYDSGCAADLTAGPLTTGEPEPDSATFRVRVPARDRRGGWIEAEVTAVSNGHPWQSPPFFLAHHVDRQHVAGPVYVPVHASASTGVMYAYHCDLTGTARTDRTPATRLTRGGAPNPCVVFRGRSVRTDGGLGGLLEHLRERAEAALPR